MTTNGTAAASAALPADLESCSDDNCREFVLGRLAQEQTTRAAADLQFSEALAATRGELEALRGELVSTRGELSGIVQKLNGARSVLAVVVALSTLLAQAAPHLPWLGPLLRALAGAP